jgi:hypothetical protein
VLAGAVILLHPDRPQRGEGGQLAQPARGLVKSSV